MGLDDAREARYDAEFINFGPLWDNVDSVCIGQVLVIRTSTHPEAMAHIAFNAYTEGRQDFADGGLQPRARRASQSFGLAALAESLTHCRIMDLSHGGEICMSWTGSCPESSGHPERPTCGRTARRCSASWTRSL